MIHCQRAFVAIACAAVFTLGVCTDLPADDGGWTIVHSGLSRRSFRLAFVDADDGWAVGSVVGGVGVPQSTVGSKTSDGGQTWPDIDIPFFRAFGECCFHVAHAPATLGTETPPCNTRPLPSDVTTTRTHARRCTRICGRRRDASAWRDGPDGSCTMTRRHAKRVVWTAPGEVALEDITVRDPHDGEVVVGAEATLISPGTERAFLLGLDNAKGAFPRASGYSYVGYIEEVGPGVDTHTVGERVVCAASHMSHAVVPADRCVHVPAHVSSEDATFFNLCAIALQGVRKARIELGEAVVTFGGGLIGLLAMRLARLSGAAPVITVDLHESRRDFACGYGADKALDPRDDAFADHVREAAAALESKAHDAPQVVIDATGFPEAILQAFHISGHMARVVLLGSSRGTTPDVDFYRDVHRKGLVLLGAHASTVPSAESSAGRWTWRNDVETALRLMEASRLDVQPLITDRLPAHKAPDVFGRIAEWDPAVLGAVLQWA